MNILVVAPHADDIEIGMGGTVARYAAEGHNIRILTAIIPCEDSDGNSSKEAKDIRSLEAKKAAKILGAEIDILDLNPYEFCFDRKHTKIFDSYIKKFNPDALFASWEHDSHQDHQSLAKILLAASRKNTFSFYMYETMMPGGISTNHFRPQYFVNISDYIDKKMNSLEAYSSVFGSNQSYFDSIKGRAKFRGEQIGREYGEAFEVVKLIEH